jgi:CTP:molybdopterin cytidylyltransferase MocA
MGGVDKLLLPVGGVAMVRRSALLYCELGMPLTVVTGAHASAVADAVAGLDVRLVANADADNGQQTSVLAGLLATPLAAPGVLVALADQPLLTSADIAALVAAFAAQAGQRIGVPWFAGKRGNPVIFPAAIVRRLRAPGGLAPRAFIDAHPELVAWFDASNDHFTRDVDTPEDAAELIGTSAPGREHD